MILDKLAMAVGYFFLAAVVILVALFLLEAIVDMLKGGKR
jgi:hypothetical protein